MIKIYPSLISSKILNLENEIKKLEPYCDGFHLDIMDFHFVPNLTFGHLFVNEIAKITEKQLFVHLMVSNPESWLDVLQLRKNDIFSFHFESTKNYKNIIDKIHSNGWQASIAIKPETKISQIYSIIDLVDQVLVMSVEPGFSGQKFIPQTFEKVKELIQYSKKNNLLFRIAIDGGINETNIAELAKIGVDDFAIASAIFKTDNPINELEKLYSLIKN